jgi:hypothetical protein
MLAQRARRPEAHVDDPVRETLGQDEQLVSVGAADLVPLVRGAHD